MKSRDLDYKNAKQKPVTLTEEERHKMGNMAWRMERLGKGKADQAARKNVQDSLDPVAGIGTQNKEARDEAIRGFLEVFQPTATRGLAQSAASETRD